MSGTHITGQLLVATPQIEEGVFARSVVLVLHHDDDGAQGLVLNRPIDADVDAVLPPGDTPEPTGVRRLFGSVALVDLDTPPLLVVPELSGLRIFAGYAGWSPGQLEVEIRTGSWYVVETESNDAFTDEPDGLWRRVLRRQRDPLRWVAWFPDDPSMN